MGSKTELQRITRIMNHNHGRGLNSERVNKIYRKILALKFGSVGNKF
jgi:hypothetical protein